MSFNFNDPFLVKFRWSFGDVLDIVPIDDSVTKLTARYEVCGQKGFFTVRKTCDTRTELIGGVDVYMAVCLKHYINNQIVIKAICVYDLLTPVWRHLLLRSNYDLLWNELSIYYSEILFFESALLVCYFLVLQVFFFVKGFHFFEWYDYL